MADNDYSEGQAIEFAEWLELEGFRIKGMDDTMRMNIYSKFLKQQHGK